MRMQATERNEAGVSVRILGTLALVTAERQSIEATMTFPMPVHAALVGLSAQIGGRRLVAQTQWTSPGEVESTQVIPSLCEQDSLRIPAGPQV
ncbi:hypothetical protein MHZ93_05055 [Roseomonas sp. ACRSG]|nr:hypothetical protein [Roseomonas sp. ACRSG]